MQLAAATRSVVVGVLWNTYLSTSSDLRPHTDGRKVCKNTPRHVCAAEEEEEEEEDGVG